jgi:hypothetical protein
VKRSLIADLLPPNTPAVPVRTVFTYRCDDPWAVTFSFWAGSRGWVDWTMSRQLVANGISSAAGEGDVRIEPDPDHESRTLMRVESPSGCALFSFDTNELQALLALTTDLVPIGAEHTEVDLDSEIAGLLTKTGD